MTRVRRTTVALLLAASLGAAGCQSEDAVEQDAQDAVEDVRDQAEDAGREAEKSIPGDSDGDGQ